MNERFLADMAARHFNYAFVHYRDTDSAGHAFGWGGSAYRQAIKNVDGYLAAVLVSWKPTRSWPAERPSSSPPITAACGSITTTRPFCPIATRYTVFFDPGRVKRGILPNKQMGRALAAGKRYTLLVKREWRDGHGLPLKEEFRHEFRASPPLERPLSMAAWKVAAPAAGTREPVVVTFPDPLDHGLLRRALGVARGGAALEGDVAIEGAETRWRFTPRDPWVSGDYDLVALAFLEDLAGNRIGRAFEVDNFERTDLTPEPERRTLAFTVGR